jgi:hypothetical protein
LKPPNPEAIALETTLHIFEKKSKTKPRETYQNATKTYQFKNVYHVHAYILLHNM